MSHAANIRNRQRSEQDQLPSKRRKTDQNQPYLFQSNHVSGLTNGVSTKTQPFEANATKDAKAPSSTQPVESDAKIRVPEDEHDADMADSDEDAGDSDDDESVVDSSDEPMSEAAVEDTQDATATNGNHPEDESSTEQAQAPSFADLLRQKGRDAIDVPSIFADDGNAPASSLAPPTKSRALSAPTATSLGTVLTQALKTNDTNLLESCFQVQNLDSIRATIERLQSTHATSLLQRLAERLHKRPGRAGSLMVWVQWTVVAHGGYLASQPTAMKELHTLYQVVRQRATGLQPLLALKGKLDMLEAQMELRKNMQSYARVGARSIEQVTYVEGQESGSEGGHTRSTGQSTAAMSHGVTSKKKKPSAAPALDADYDSEDDDVPTNLTNGLDVHLEEDGDAGSSGDSEDVENLIDDEAEETAEEDSDVLSEEVEYEDDDDDDDEAGQDPDSEGEELVQKHSKRAARA